MQCQSADGYCAGKPTFPCVPNLCNFTTPWANDGAYDLQVSQKEVGMRIDGFNMTAKARNIDEH